MIASPILAIRADERRLTNQPLNWSNAQKKRSRNGMTAPEARNYQKKSQSST